jgi:anti-anti-sigma factor
MFKRRKQGAVNVVSGNVPLTGQHTQDLGVALAECLLDGQPKAVLELQNVPLIDSAGLELLLDMQEQFERRAGVLKLASPNALCSDILVATGVGHRFEVYREAKAAIGSFVQ